MAIVGIYVRFPGRMAFDPNCGFFWGVRVLKQSPSFRIQQRPSFRQLQWPCLVMWDIHSNKLTCRTNTHKNPAKIEWDLTNGPLSKLVELLDTPVWGSVQ